MERVITIGTPHRGSAKALDGLMNGLRLPGPAGERLDQFVRSLPSIRELTPTDPCVRRPDGTMVAPADSARVPTEWSEPAVRLHHHLARANAARHPRDISRLNALSGTNQPTLWSLDETTGQSFTTRDDLPA